MPRVRFAHPVATAVTAVLLAGCGSSDDEGTPAACLVPASAYTKALAAAPEAVTLEAGTSISDCVPADQTAADQADVGMAVIESAKQLNAAARDDPGGRETVALGYLVGAVQEGAAASGGIHADLVRSLDAAARFAPDGEPLSLGFERAFNEGYAAGQQNG